jgi:hypothetical protein
MIYEAPNGTEYKLAKNSQTGLIAFTPVEGGGIPKDLSGYFTKQKFVDEAWNKYVISCEKQPDQRLKENKK